MPGGTLASHRDAEERRGRDARRVPRADWFPLGSNAMAKKTSKKQTAKKASGRRPGPAASKPKPVKTGSGAAPAEVGRELVALFSARDDAGVMKRLWSPSIESIEGAGVGLMWKGKAACALKSEEWAARHKVHAASAEGLYVGATGFAVRFRMDVETLATGKRETMEEVGVYTVKNGKIIREEFMYSA